MATLAYGARDNLFSIAKTKDSMGKLLDLTCTMCEANAMLQDFPTKPANGGRFHQGVRTAKLPSGQIVTVGGTWGSEKTEYAPFTEGLFSMRSSYEIALDVLEQESDIPGFLSQEDKNFSEGLSQSWANLLVQGTSTPNEAAIEGLSKRTPYASLGEYCIDGSAGKASATDYYLRSAWLVCPGVNTVHFLYNPAHPTMGVERKDRGATREMDLVDIEAGGVPGLNPRHRWITSIEYAFEQGICIRDYKAMKRICNIPCGATDVASNDFLNAIIQARYQHTVVGQSSQMTYGGGPQWFLYVDPMLYIKLVQGANANIKVLQSDRNIYRVNLDMIGDIIIRKMDSLGYPMTGTAAQGTTGEALVS